MVTLPKHNPNRRNKSTTAATLYAVPDPKPAPMLPAEVDWEPRTIAWWDAIWASPMAPEYDDSDEHGLVMLAVLINDFWSAPSATARKDALAEIRLQGQRFGLSPIDRRRLQWQIEATDEAQDRGRKRRAATPKPKATDGGFGALTG